MPYATRNAWTLWSAVALAAMLVAVALVAGVGEDGAAQAVRATARTSLVFFSLAFASWGLDRRSWPARQRHGLLAALAVSHGLHPSWRWPTAPPAPTCSSVSR